VSAWNFYFYSGKSKLLVGLFSPIKIPSVGALAAGNAVDTGIGNVSEGVRLRLAQIDRKTNLSWASLL
jgi:hypothetical protein